MANCSSCSAPLPANSQICRYCGVRNDLDISGKMDFRLSEPVSERICPDCQIALQTVSLEKSGLSIERCQQCYGLFFDPHELESLLEHSVSQVNDIQLERINNINRERYNNQPVRYVPCPVCQVLMNRVAFGRMSGIVVNKCSSHGIWLNGGALSHLLEWKKAGGQLLHSQAATANRQIHNSSARSHSSSNWTLTREEESDWWPTLSSVIHILDWFI